jgi:hypothetical protein
LEIRLQESDNALMKRQVIVAILKLSAESVLLTLFAAIVIGIIGNSKKWDTNLEYSNAFFIAGSLVIVAGVFSRFGSRQGWNDSQELQAESSRDKNSGQQTNIIVNASGSFRLVIICLLSGILLIATSVLVMELF